jgi:phosphoglycolate phosphatase (TIGR01487 family)
MRIKAVVADVDGTLTDERRRLDIDSILAVRRLEERGLKVVLTSGRSYCATHALSTYIGTFGLVIAENGGVIGRGPGDYTLMGDRSLAELGLKELRKELGDRVREVQSFQRYVDIVLARTFDLNPANEMLQRRGAGSHILDSGFAYHLVDARVDKGVGVEAAARKLMLETEEIAAIGDNLNDIDMFKVAGFSATFPDAPEQTRRAATYIANRRHGEGVREIAEVLLSGRSEP